MVDDPVDREMVTAIHRMGKVMGKSTIAEFVENDTILKALREIGVDYAQGYGVAKPRPFCEMTPDCECRTTCQRMQLPGRAGVFSRADRAAASG
jgi:EAL domain-containing protein (putative c-di-GMP-specific phosphodiesterase class I)